MAKCNGSSQSSMKIFEEGEDCKAGWKTAKANFSSGKNHLEICGKPVMERWETPYMHKLASVAASKGGRVLEIGFGLAICATKIQSFDIEEHVIVECNDEVFAELEEWAKTVPHKVTALRGSWQDVVPTLEDGTFDGITYDTFPMTREAWHTHHFEFIRNHAYRLLRPGGVLTYSNIMSFNELMNTKYTDLEVMFQETQIRELVEAGFKKENITTDTVSIDPPKECTYCSYKTMIVPCITK